MTAASAQTIDSWLANHARHRPGHTALRFEGKTWTYEEFSGLIGNIAAELYGRYKLRRGDRLGFLGYNSDIQVALIFAAAKIGAMVVPLNWRLADNELAYVVENCGAKLLVLGAEVVERGAAICNAEKTATLEERALRDLPKHVSCADLPSADLSDPLLIVYTSGTTGKPKGAVHRQEAILWNALASLHMHDFSADDHTLNILPLFHIGGINIQMLPTFFVGGSVTLHPGFDPERTLAAFEHEGITSSVCVPTVMRAIMALPQWATSKLPNLRLLTTGSTDVPVSILQEVNRRGIPMTQVYGATETGPIATYQRIDEAAKTIGSIGRAAAHGSVYIADAAGAPMGVGETGEIWVKAPNTFSHYWDDPAASASATHEGWFKTGDLAYQDSDGLFWFKGRQKHVIISGGENIYPAEIERILEELPGVREVCVVGRKDEKWGEVPVAAVVVDSDGPSVDTLRAAFQGKIAKFKQPKDIAILPELPKNALGKVVLPEVVAKIS